MLFHGRFLSNTWMFFLQMMYAILLYIPEIILFILNVFDILTRLIKFNVWKSCLDPGNNSAVLDRSVYLWRKTAFWEIGIFVSSRIELNALTLILMRKIHSLQKVWFPLLRTSCAYIIMEGNYIMRADISRMLSIMLLLKR